MEPDDYKTFPLEPCPFCGCEMHTDFPRTTYAVAKGKHDEFCPLRGVITNPQKNGAMVAVTWNRRMKR